MKVYLVRYGEVNHNLYKLYNREDEYLNETGIKQAEELREKIKNIEYDFIISSPLSRARQTADIINIDNKNIVIDDRLKERDPGSVSGQPLEVTKREEPERNRETFSSVYVREPKEVPAEKIELPKRIDLPARKSE